MPGRTASTQGHRVSPSTLIAGAFIAAAGAVAWIGMSASDGNGPPPATPLTLAAAATEGAPAVRLAPIASGVLPTRIVVPSAGIDAAVVEVGVVEAGGRAQWETAWRAAGHHLDSARPGQPGNMVISGHVSVADRNNIAVFRSLEGVAAGDIVEVHAGDEVYRYEVDSVSIVQPTALDALRSDHSARVTLITCTRDLKHRLVVSGRLV
ncbi:MAG: sortase [Dehalococcoidia bacterium]